MTDGLPYRGLLYVAGKDARVGQWIETTEGRRDILQPLNKQLEEVPQLQTRWSFSTTPDLPQPLMLACVITCDSRTTRGSLTHMETQSHGAG